MPSAPRDSDEMADNSTATPAPLPYEEQLKYLSPISKPLASSKTTRHALKLVKKASKERAVHRGVKEVVKAIRRNRTGICIMAGDISPIDVIAHIPVLCEDHQVRYIFVPSKEYLGAASMTKRPTSCIFVDSPGTSSAYKKRYSKFLAEIEKIWKSYTRIKSE